MYPVTILMRDNIMLLTAIKAILSFKWFYKTAVSVKNTPPEVVSAPAGVEKMTEAPMKRRLAHQDTWTMWRNSWTSS